MIADLHSADHWRRMWTEATLTDPVEVDALCVCLRDGLEAETRWRAAAVLGHLEDSRAVEALRAALHDPEWEVRVNVLQALARISDPLAFGDILARVTHPDEDEQVRYVAALALLRLDRERALLAFESALPTADEAARRTIWSALVVERTQL